MMNMMEATDSDGEFAPSKGVKTPLWSGAAYSSALSKSMRAIGRVRGGRQAAAADKETGAALFADAVARKDKEKMLDALAKDPSILRQSVDNGQLPLHLVCSLRPSYRFVDLMTMMINTYPECVRHADKNGQTPLHALCGNPSVTVQALAVFAASMEDIAAMHDNDGNLPLHLLCRNASCDVRKIKQLGPTAASFCAINEEGQTPLHYTVTAETPQSKTVESYLLETFPDAALMRDMVGRTLLHWVCEREQQDEEVFNKLLAVGADAASLPDKNGDLPLHILCQNEKLTREILHLLLQKNPSGVYSVAKNKYSPLHFLCSNEACSVDILTEFFTFDKDNIVCSRLDVFGASALHMICMNKSITTDTLRILLLMSPDDAFVQDMHGRSPLHYMCMNSSLSSELLWLFFDRGIDLVRQIDMDGRTPLHYLCNNIIVTPRLLEILFDAYPSAALVADLEFKLPVQYLVDNTASTPDITAVLICGPASYRHRYEFLNASEQCVCFTQAGELIYIQTNAAMDSNTATKVLMIFFSSSLIIEHERKMLLHLQSTAGIRGDHVDYAPKLIETFDGAKRRVALRSIDVAPEDQNGDASVILDHALVLEAPQYTLEGLQMEKHWDTEAVRAITTEIANCLLFWHVDARAVHGNITLRNIGQFEGRGLCLYNLSASREFHEQRRIGSRSITLSSCPPEAAKAFVAKEEFLPTPASDIWQFGCIVYQVLTGKTILERLAPWIHSVGHEQGLHLICTLTDNILEPLIVEADPEFRVLLQRTLVVNPNYRWGIDRLMRISDVSTKPSFATSEASSDSFVGSTLQQKADDVLLDSASGNRSTKHAQEQLEFMKKEQTHLRHSLLATKSKLRDVEQARCNLQAQVEDLQTQRTNEEHQKREAQLEAQLLARNHQAMTLQLHTTVQMLLNLVPLARTVYGAQADDFLSHALSQATGGPSPTIFPTGSSIPKRKEGPVQLLKSQLQQSVLAHGCVQKWANSNASTAVAAAELTCDGQLDGKETPSEDSNKKAKSSDQAEDLDGAAAAMA